MMRRLVVILIALWLAACTSNSGQQTNTAVPSQQAQYAEEGENILVADLGYHGFQRTKVVRLYSSDSRRVEEFQYWSRQATTIEIVDSDVPGSFRILSISRKEAVGKWAKVWCTPVVDTELLVRMVISDFELQYQTVAAGDFTEEIQVASMGVYRLMPGSRSSMPCYGEHAEK